VSVANEPVEPPNAVYTHQRFIKSETVEWVEECDRILTAYGLVRCTGIHEKRKTARNRCERLIRYMVDLKMHERWELIQHVERKDGGYIWSVELRGGNYEPRPERNADAARGADR
jgi:hypothetical protein